MKNRLYSSMAFKAIRLSGNIFFSFLKRMMNTNRLQFCFIALIIVTLMTIWNLVGDNQTKEDYKISQNYFRQLGASPTHNGFLVDTSKCRIANLTLWSEEVLPFFENREPACSCQEEIRAGTINGLTFIRKQVIVINETMVKHLGLTMSGIDCCYRTIDRVQQDYTNYNESADNTFHFSDQCYPMTSTETTPISGFTKVTCTIKVHFLWWSWNRLIHTDFHLLATFRNLSLDVSHKLEYWKNSNRSRPPNVLMLGIDSTSRMNLRRFMPKTLDVLENVIGAVEMNGYTKVGENTYPNFVPLFSSYSEKELVPICYKTPLTAQDECPYIWKNFSVANYLTGHIEDESYVNAFNYWKNGFVVPPADIYPRSWMQAVYEHRAFGKAAWFKRTRCIDSRTPEEFILRYVVDMAELAESHGIPYFITTWMTGLTHNIMDGVWRMDSAMAEAIVTLHGRGHLKNTVLLVMGDHGYRFLPIRLSSSGWHEDKLPALWITLPETVKELKPSWADALQYNSRQLATPFDVHETFDDILRLANTINPDEQSLPVTPNSQSLRGLSLFENLPERSCDEAGVPVGYCACGSLVEYTGNQGFLQLAAQWVMDKINSELPSERCSRVGVGSVIAAGVSEDRDRLVIGVRSSPQDMEVEAVVLYNDTSGNWDVVDLMRTNGLRKCKLANTSSLFCQC